MNTFADNLQNKTSHEALVSLQDAELRLLENMRKCISLRVKCDREYAVALNSIHSQALKAEQAEEFKSSVVARAWTSVVEETNSLSYLVKQNADFLATRTLETLNNLILEKRALRKHYVEEHGRIHGQLSKMQENVIKIKIEYEKCMESWKIAKAKYEDQYIKGKNNKKIEELKEKYQKTTRKLHRLHNEYILLLCEASEYEQRLRRVLIPDLLEYQQIVLQESVETWKSILKEYSHYTDVTSEGFQSIQKKMRETVEKVTGEEEYKEFSIKNKSVPLEPVAFQFEEKILEDYTGKLKPSELTVDDFTFDGLKSKMEDVWSKLTQIKGDIKSRENQMTQYEAEISALRRTADTALTLSVKKRAVDILKKQLGELKCQEEILKKLWEILDAPLTMIGPEGPPPGLELDDTSFNHKIEEETMSITSHKVGRSAKVVLDRICSQLHIKRSSPGEASPRLPPRSVAMNNSLSPLSKPSKTSSHNTSSEDAPDLLGIREERRLTDSSREMKDLRDEDWFHGVLPREEVVRLLAKDGDYLVRETLRNEESQIVLSASWQGYKHFIVQTTSEGKFRFEGPAFNSIQELIHYQHNCGLPVTNRSGAILKNPILRERWELNNDDVELVEKIGRGNFGDVYKAILKSTNEEVAVKTCRMNLPDEQKKKFLQEGRILKQYDHPNIVKFIGIGVQKQPIMIVMELIRGGSLLLYLRNHSQTLTVLQLLTLSIQAASGMEYLESKGCIHRDLAARNCLVGQGDIVKISDFGMSREEEEYIVSDGMKQIPIKWTAPEALNFGKYTSLCDVWSFGILAWEIMSLGSTPYCGLSNNQTRELIDTGYRLPNPENTPDAVYELLLRCWEYTPERRPHFQEIRTLLEAIAADYAGIGEK